jgi:GNAT superfamily N-acetyltransferase
MNLDGSGEACRVGGVAPWRSPGRTAHMGVIADVVVRSEATGQGVAGQVMEQLERGCARWASRTPRGW